MTVGTWHLQISRERMRMLSTCLKEGSIMLGAYVEFFLLLLKVQIYVEQVWMDVEYQRCRLDQLCNLCVSGPNPFYILCFVMLGLDSANRVNLPVAFCYSMTKGALQRTTELEEKGEWSFFPFFFSCQLGSCQYHKSLLSSVWQRHFILIEAI